MKNAFLLSLVALLCLNVNSQVVEFKLSNPMPRVGQSITVSYSILSQDHPKFSFKEIDAPRKGKCTDSKSVIASGSFSQRNGREEPGKVTYGPFEFRVDDEVYKSDKIEFEVYPKLPNVQVGVWLTLVENSGKHYLVLEERVPGKVMPPRPNTSEYNKPTIYAALDEDKFNSLNISVASKRKSSRSGSKLEGDIPDYEKTYTTFVTTYELWIGKDYMGDAVVTSDFILNLPQGHVIENINIIK